MATKKTETQTSAAPRTPRGTRPMANVVEMDNLPKTMPTTAKKTITSKTKAPLIVRAFREPTHDEIAKRAYQLFVERGYQHGHEQSDWLRAETELRKL